MNIDRAKLYENFTDYFETSGFTTMKLARNAAVALCVSAAERGIIIVMVEGGIFRKPTFEARLDAIWAGADPPIEQEAADKNNLAAAEFIRSRSNDYNAFIVTSAPVTGYQAVQCTTGGGKMPTKG